MHQLGYINKGDFVALMGASGCGKTTLLNVLGLLDTWDDGEYIFMGHSLSKKTERQRVAFRKQHISFVFQNFNLIEHLSVLENVKMPLLYHSIGEKDRRNAALECLERLDLGNRVNHAVNKLSGGQQQRVAIARALVSRPALLLADEPTGNLDSENGLQVMNILKELNEAGHTLIMVTHSERDAAFASNVLHMRDGQIIS